MNNKYEELDALIIESVKNNGDFLYRRDVNLAAQKIAENESREAFRVIDCRAQALRKTGKISFQKGKNSKWIVSEDILNSSSGARAADEMQCVGTTRKMK